MYSRSESVYYHWSGAALIAQGQHITADVISALAAAGIGAVYSKPPAQLRIQQLEPANTSLLKENSPSPYTIWTDDGIVLAREGEMLVPAKYAVIDSGRVKICRVIGDEGRQPGAFRKAYVARLRARLDEAIVFGGCKLRPERSGVPLVKTARVFAGHSTPHAVLQAYEKYYAQAVLDLERMWDGVRKAGYLRHAELATYVEVFIDRLSAERELMQALAAARLDLPATAEQCVGTAVYALAIALRLGYGRGQARDLVVAALLHDMGNALMPRGLLEAPRSLTREEREALSLHVDYGLFLMSRVEWPSESSLIAIYQHHERATGAGYPKGFTGAKLHEYALVIAAADVFHALISDRPHRKAYPCAEAVERLTRMAELDLLDRDVVKALVDETGVWPIGACVTLSTGETARVVAPTDTPSAPWVGVVLEADGSRLSRPRFVHLAKEDQITIRAEVESFAEPLVGF